MEAMESIVCCWGLKLAVGDAGDEAWLVGCEAASEPFIAMLMGARAVMTT